MSDDLIVKLVQLLEQIRACTDRAKLQPLWRETFNMLKKTAADANHVAHVVAGRNVEGLAKTIAALRPPPPPPGAGDTGVIQDDAPIPAAHDVKDEQTLKAAMKVFRRRFKFAKLDEESRLGRGHLTKGENQGFSIEAPLDYTRAIWDELARRGQLKKDGKGFYELGPEAD